jgi:hypothetical protein
MPSTIFADCWRLRPALDERGQETVRPLVELDEVAAALDVGVRAAESQEQGEPRIALLERAHDLGAAAADLVLRLLERALRLLLRELEDRALVGLGVEQDTARAGAAGDAGGERRVRQHARVVAEPVDVAGRDVEAQEVVPEPGPADRLQVAQVVRQLGFAPAPLAPRFQVKAPVSPLASLPPRSPPTW